MKELQLKRLVIEQLEKEGFEVVHGKRHSGFAYSPTSADIVVRKSRKFYVFEIKAPGTLEQHYYQMHRAIGQCLFYFLRAKNPKPMYKRYPLPDPEFHIMDRPLKEELKSIDKIYIIMSSSDKEIQEIVDFYNLPIKLIVFRPPQHVEIEPQL